MKLGIMQPYFFPYIGYFDLIFQTDQWIIFDTVQYIRHGWVNRNRILHPQEGWQYIIVPTQKHDQKITIKDVRIANGEQWKNKLIAQLQHYKKKAPFFTNVIEVIYDCLKYTDGSLNKLNATCLEKICSYIGIRFNYSFFSEMNLDIGSVEKPGDWALRIAEAYKADEYINPPGGADLFNIADFERAGIKLTIQKPISYEYYTDGYEFQPNLSIIDVMMWNSPSDIQDYLISRNQEVG